jgi:hypothetical protein
MLQSPLSISTPRSPATPGPYSGRSSGEGRTPKTPSAAVGGYMRNASTPTTPQTLTEEEMIAFRERRFLHNVIFSIDRSLLDTCLQMTIDLWSSKLEHNALPECTPEIVEETLEAYRKVKMCGNIRLKQVAFFMALNVSEEWRDCVCMQSPPDLVRFQFVPEPNQKANKFFSQLQRILTPHGDETVTPTTAHVYTTPEDYMQAVALAYSGLLFVEKETGPLNIRGEFGWDTALKEIKNAVAQLKKADGDVDFLKGHAPQLDKVVRNAENAADADESMDLDD